MTLEVGTRLYIAPEVQRQKGRSKPQDHSKADVYSLGVSLKLLWTKVLALIRSSSDRFLRDELRPFQDRLRTDLRDRGRSQTRDHLPSGWPAARVRQKSIVTWLLQHEPSKRPTALELSQSDLVPARVEDENIKSALSMIGMCFCSLLSILLTEPASQIGFPSFPGRSEHALPPADRADP
jgi:translation initiation factor 2-alpha kinase 4